MTKGTSTWKEITMMLLSGMVFPLLIILFTEIYSSKDAIAGVKARVDVHDTHQTYNKESFKELNQKLDKTNAKLDILLERRN